MSSLTATPSSRFVSLNSTASRWLGFLKFFDNRIATIAFLIVSFRPIYQAVSFCHDRESVNPIIKEDSHGKTGRQNADGHGFEEPQPQDEVLLPSPHAGIRQALPGVSRWPGGGGNPGVSSSPHCSAQCIPGNGQSGLQRLEVFLHENSGKGLGCRPAAEKQKSPEAAGGSLPPRGGGHTASGHQSQAQDRFDRHLCRWPSVERSRLPEAGAHRCRFGWFRERDRRTGIPF